VSRRKAVFLGTSLAFVGILLVTTIIANLIVGQLPSSAARFDLTQNKEYTLTPATKSIFSKLKDLVTVTYYVSKDLPSGVANLRQDTVDFLNELQLVAPSGLLRIEVVDPVDEAQRIAQEREESKKQKKEVVQKAGDKVEEEDDMDFDPFSGGMTKKKRSEYDKALEELQRKGIRPLRSQTIKQDRAEISLYYSALVLSYKGKESEVIADHRSLENLEYEIASRVLKLTIPEEEKPVIAFFNGQPKKNQEPPNPAMPMPPQQDQEEYQVLKFQVLQQLFKVTDTKLTESDPIPPKTKTLIVAQPKDLNDRQLYEINRFVSSGGKAIFFVGKYAVDLKQMFPRVMPVATGLDKLLAGWGVRLDARPLNSEQCGFIMLRQRGRVGPLGNVEFMQPAGIPLHIAAFPAEFKRDLAWLQGINVVVLPWSVALNLDTAEALKGKNLEAEVLVQSSAKSWFGQPSAMSIQQLMANGPQENQENFADWSGRQTVVAMIKGKFPFMYEGKDVPPWPKEEKDDADADKDKGKAKEQKPPETPQKAVLEQAQDSIVIVVGSPDFVKDEYLQYDRNYYAGSFIFMRNVVEAFSLSDELVSIRAKESSRRPLDPDMKPWAKNALKWFNVLGVPFLVAIAGMVYAMFRARGSALYERRVAGKRDTAGGVKP
jgi:ABC-2 type transport system permease protein